MPGPFLAAPSFFPPPKRPKAVVDEGTVLDGAVKAEAQTTADNRIKLVFILQVFDRVLKSRGAAWNQKFDKGLGFREMGFSSRRRFTIQGLNVNLAREFVVKILRGRKW